MHQIQEKLMSLASSKNIGRYTLRQLADMIGEEGRSPQVIKHHLNQLEARGLIKVDKKSGLIEKVKSGVVMFNQGQIVKLPIVGSANCGPATIFAETNIEGYLMLSTSMISPSNPKNLFVLKAQGLSMNKAGIDDGDFLIIDSSIKHPDNGDTVVSVIDDVANVKKFINDKASGRVMLISESTLDFPPIIIDANDNFSVNGKVVKVIKKHNK